ncbi:RT RNaseH 2 domain-containing protein [Abeliophyllum distichum]|uniref:RT RNaseH 2 domain-containing protein n=1 Tax=Abeliophyllum distichum TaxID=126358 RepID=A0ABD1PTT1_9LAMI
MPQFRPPISNNLKFTMSYKKAAISQNPEKIPDRFKVLGKIPERKEDLIVTDVRLQDFMTLEEEARTIGETAPEKNYLGTLEKKFGQFIFFEGADPLMVKNAFHCGLVKMIIPGPEFEVLKLIDDKILKSLKDFRKYVIKSHNIHMILKINSTIPFWDENNILIRGYHHIQIKTTQQVIIDQPIEGQAHYVSPILLEDWRALSFQRLITGLKFFNGESKVKVNHASKFILMTSKTSSTISAEGIKALCKFEETFYNKINAPTNYNGHLCPALRSSLGKYHRCELCKITEKKEETDLTKGKEKVGVDDFVDAEFSKIESSNSPADSAYQSE